MASAKQSAIACIGWGSLVWDAKDLPCLGIWHNDGPLLPVEFARESADKRITLVICPGVPIVRTCWSLLDVPDMPSARTRLAMREYGGANAKWIENNIGFWDRESASSRGLEADTITEWADKLGLAGVVWTNLPCKFGGQNNVMPTGEQVVAHMRGLDENARAAAEKYVRKAPLQIDTPHRRLLTQEFGWTHQGFDSGSNDAGPARPT